MTLDTLLDKPVTLHARTITGQDKYGQPVYTDAEHASSCYYRLATTDSQDEVARDSIDFTVYLPVDAPVDEQLQWLEIDGWRYDVVGTPFRQWNPRQARDEFWVVSVRRAAS